MHFLLLILTTISLQARAQKPTGLDSVFGECVDFVNESQTINSRAEAAIHCKSVKSMECVHWVFESHNIEHQADHQEDAADACHNVKIGCAKWVLENQIVDDEKSAALACANVDLLECAQWVSDGGTIGSREEAAAACRFVHSMECVNTIYADPLVTIREDAAAACQEHN